MLLCVPHALSAHLTRLTAALSRGALNVAPVLEALMRSSSLAKLKSQARLELFARQHRRSPTESEALLWSALTRQLGVSFRRQVPPAGHFIADFFAPSIGLVVEVDGAIHARRAPTHLVI